MKQSINFSDFIDAFKRFDRYDGYGYEALKVIYNYLEEYEEETGQEIELDVIAICCDYTVQGHTGIAQDYSINLSDAKGDCYEEERIVLDYLNENTMVLGQCETGIVYQAF
jgi:hypothetical protein